MLQSNMNRQLSGEKCCPRRSTGKLCVIAIYFDSILCQLVHERGPDIPVQVVVSVWTAVKLISLSAVAVPAENVILYLPYIVVAHVID